MHNMFSPDRQFPPVYKFRKMVMHRGNTQDKKTLKTASSSPLSTTLLSFPPPGLVGVAPPRQFVARILARSYTDASREHEECQAHVQE